MTTKEDQEQIKKAIGHFENIRDDANAVLESGTYPEESALVYNNQKMHAELAINVLNKELLQMPDYEGDGCDDRGNTIYDTWICPFCKTSYEVDYDNYKYCPECGQRIDLVSFFQTEKTEERNNKSNIDTYG